MDPVVFVQCLSIVYVYVGG